MKYTTKDLELFKLKEFEFKKLSEKIDAKVQEVLNLICYLLKAPRPDDWYYYNDLEGKVRNINIDAPDIKIWVYFTYSENYADYISALTVKHYDFSYAIPSAYLTMSESEIIESIKTLSGVNK